MQFWCQEQTLEQIPILPAHSYPSLFPPELCFAFWDAGKHFFLIFFLGEENVWGGCSPGLAAVWIWFLGEVKWQSKTDDMVSLQLL